MREWNHFRSTIHIRLRSRKFLVNEFFHPNRYLPVKWINRYIFDVWPVPIYGLRVSGIVILDTQQFLRNCLFRVFFFLIFFFLSISFRWFSIFLEILEYFLWLNNFWNDDIIILIKVDRNTYLFFFFSIIGKERCGNSLWEKWGLQLEQIHSGAKLLGIVARSRVTLARFSIDLMPSVFQRNSVTLQILFSTANCPQVLVETVNRYAMLMKFVYSRH